MDLEKEIEKRKLHLIRNEFQCGIGTNLNTHVYTNRIQNHSFVISWMLRCTGTMEENGRIYQIRDECVSLRRPDRDYRMHLPVTNGLRMYLQFPGSVYPTLLWIMPELSQMDPVWDQPWNDGLIRDFFAIYDLTEKLPATELYTAFPQIIRFMLQITGIQKKRSEDPLSRARLLLEENNSASLEEIAGRCGMNYNTFRKRFTEAYGISPHRYRICHRIELAKKLLESGLPVKETAEQLGYPDIYSFTHQFTALTGIPPSVYRK